MQVLIIGFVWPEPCSSAAGSRMLELVDSFLGQGWETTFACSALNTLHQVDLVERGVACQSIALNCDSFDEFVAGLRPDIVLFDRFMVEEQFGWRVAAAWPSALRVLDTEDLHSLRKARGQQLHKLSGECGDKLEEYFHASSATLFQWMASEDLAYREIAAIQRSDLTLMISEFEQALLVREFGVAPAKLHYCPFMRPLAGPVQDNFEQRRHFVSLGNFRHAPNWDAVLWLKQRIWPGIRAALPDAELHVYGAYPPPKATALHNARDGFLVKGWAADAHEVLAQARVLLAPLRFGAGLKGKLADAMSVGTPSVTTPLGAEGMEGAGPWPGAVADQPDALVAWAVELYSNHARWRQAQLDGTGLINQRFSADCHREPLIDKLLDSAGQLSSLRQADFTGAMLRHHFHQSTRYMSRWIQAKTRLKEAAAE